MEDFEFDKIMETYVSTTAKGKEADLSKLTDEVVAEAKTRRKKRRNAFRAMMACVGVVILTLCIALPVALTGGEGADDAVLNGATDTEDSGLYEDGTDAFYGDDSNVNYIYFTAQNPGKPSDYGVNIMLPDMEYVTKLLGVMTLKSDDSEVIGATISYFIMDGGIFEVNGKVIADGYAWKPDARYAYFDKSVVWDGLNVKYETEYGEDQGFVYIYFVKDGYKYYLTVTCYEETEIIALLDTVYSQSKGGALA